MADTLFAYILHTDGKVDDTAFELISAAKKIVPGTLPTAVIFGSGGSLDTACNQLSSQYPQIWKIDHPALAYPNAEVIRGLLVRLLPENGLMLIPHEHFGMDLAPGLSIKSDAAYIPDVVHIQGLQDGILTVVREEFNGQISTHVACDISKGAVVTLRPGAFQPVEARSETGRILDKTDTAIQGDLPGGNRRFLELVEAPVGDVDITKSDILISVGRGIEEEENLEMVHALAKAMGGDVSCSRPIVDAKWLEKSRQVGTSGQTVKPKVYLALGISGSFQHMGGVKGAPFVVAVNKNPKAPIFQSADAGVVADILELIPKLTEKVQEVKG